MNGRSFNTLLQLTPGVVIAPSNSNSPGQFSIAGQRTSANNFTVDGVSADFGVQAGITAGGGSGLGQAQAFSALGGTSSLVSADDLQEFRIETSSFCAGIRTPAGRPSAAHYALGNERLAWRGVRLFPEYGHGCKRLVCEQRRVGKRGRETQRFWRICRRTDPERADLFLCFLRRRAAAPADHGPIAQVPSLSARQSRASCIAPFLNAYPIPNGPLSADGYTGQFAGGFSNSGTLNATSIRIDHFFNSHFSIFGRYNYAPSQIVSLCSPGELDTVPVNTQTLDRRREQGVGKPISNSLRGNYSTQTSNATVGAPRDGRRSPASGESLSRRFVTEFERTQFPNFRYVFLRGGKRSDTISRSS